MRNKRTLICTFVALTSGFFCAYVGGQMSWKARSYNCQAQPLGLETLCKVGVAPIAIWQGSTTGLWLGLVLGSFISGLATHQNANHSDLASGG